MAAASDYPRHAELADKMACIGLLRDSYAAAGFTFPFSAAHASALFDHHFSNRQASIFVIGDRPHGLLMAAWFDHPFGAGRYAKETVWYIAPSARGRSGLQMLDAYESWAREQGCTAIGMASLASNDVSAIYARRGYVPAETHFLKML